MASIQSTGFLAISAVVFSAIPMAVGASTLRASSPSIISSTLLDASPVLIIEHPLESFYGLSLSEQGLGATSQPPLSRLEHIGSLDVIFTDMEQVFM